MPCFYFSFIPESCALYLCVLLNRRKDKDGSSSLSSRIPSQFSECHYWPSLATETHEAYSAHGLHKAGLVFGFHTSCQCSVISSGHLEQVFRWAVRQNAGSVRATWLTFHDCWEFQQRKQQLSHCLPSRCTESS